MKNLLVLLGFLITFSAGAQNLCLQTMCNAVHCRQGDTVILGALLTANNKVGAITFTSAATNPNTPVIGPVVNGWATNIADTGRVLVTGLVPGTYLINVTGKDLAGGTVTGVDSIVVAPPVACPVIPTITGVQIFFLGQWITVPPGGQLRLAKSDGTVQTY